MKDELVSFETAKLAKEKGFNIEQAEFGLGHRYYDSNSEIRYGSIKEYDDSIYYPAPTQSLLQRWLRETQHLHIVPIFIHQENDDIDYHISIIDYREGRTRMRNAGFNKRWTYEQALEKGLIEALNLIK